MLILAIVFFVLGLLLYLAAFWQGPGPSASDRPLQGAMFTVATALMVAGFILLVV